MMKRITLLLTVALVMALMLVVAGPASATIHPIVESFDCANDQAFEHHPYGDPAEVPGQNPAVGNHSEQSSFRALEEADQSAFSDHKLDGQCGQVGQSERRAR
jgi:hypothetical protein